MLNEKILSGAAILELAEARIDEKAYKRAQESSGYEENLRSMLLAAIALSSPEAAISKYLEHVRTECWNVKSLTQDADRLLGVLRDKDIMTPSLLASTSKTVTTDIMPSVVHVPDLFIELAKIWDVKFDLDVATHLWKSTLHDASSETFDFMFKHTDVNELRPLAIAPSVKSLGSGQKLVAAFSDEKVKSALAEVREVLDSVKGDYQKISWRLSQFGSLLVLLTAEYVNRFGIEGEFGTRLLDDLAQGHIYFRGESQQMMPKLLEIARAHNRLDEPSIYEDLVEEGAINHVPIDDVAGFVAAGLPVALKVKSRSGALVDRFLLENADLDHVAAIAKVMDKASLDLYLENNFSNRAMDLMGGAWFNGRSCADRSLVTVLHSLGVDVARPRGELNMLPHQDRYHAGAYNKSEQLFVALHVLNAYPHSLRFDGYTPLHLAAAHNDVKAIRALVANGYDLNEVVEKGAEPIARVKHDGHTPLVMAIYMKHSEAIEVLIELGSDVGVKANTGATLMQLVKDDEVKRLIRSARTGAAVSKAMKSGGAELEAGAPVRHEGVIL